MQIFTQDKEATLDYGFDWNPWLNKEDSISSSNWEIRGKSKKDKPSDLSIVEQSFNNGVVGIWLKGGNVGDEYIIDNIIETQNDRVDSRSFELRIVDR